MSSAGMLPLWRCARTAWPAGPIRAVSLASALRAMTLSVPWCRADLKCDGSEEDAQRLAKFRDALKCYEVRERGRQTRRRGGRGGVHGACVEVLSFGYRYAVMCGAC
mgnify:CR=1 FL=1